MELESITDQTVVNRKTAIGSGLVALTALVLPGQVRAQAKTQPDDSARRFFRRPPEGALPARDSRT